MMRNTKVVSLAAAAVLVASGLTAAGAPAAHADPWADCSDKFTFSQSFGYVHVTVGNFTGWANDSIEVYAWDAAHDWGVRQFPLQGGQTNYYQGRTKATWVAFRVTGDNNSTICTASLGTL